MIDSKLPLRRRPVNNWTRPYPEELVCFSGVPSVSPPQIDNPEIQSLDAAQCNFLREFYPDVILNHDYLPKPESFQMPVQPLAACGTLPQVE
jgi:hypothetical protein